MATRNEVIYQSIALYSSPVTGDASEGVPSGQVSALQRVTDINWGGEVARQDINCMGKLAATAREIIEEPTVNLDFTYYLANAFNEASGIGLSVGNDTGAYGHTMTDAVAGTSIISGVLADAFGSSEKNYYILTVAQGEDADGVDLNNTDLTSDATTGYGIVGVGNAFLNDYTVNLAVGDIPNAAVSFDAANLTFAQLSGYDLSNGGFTGVGFQNPAIKRAEGTNLADLQFSGVVELPEFEAQGATGNPGDREVSVAALRPGDITVDFATAQLAAGGVWLPGMTTDKQTAHVQSVTIAVPLSRTPLTRLGNPFAFARKIDVPINTSVTVSANVGDVTTGSLVDLLCNDDVGRDITITLGERCGGANNMKYIIKKAQLDSQSMSINIGDSESVDLTFTSQIGGYNDTTHGVFLSGQKPASDGT